MTNPFSSTKTFLCLICCLGFWSGTGSADLVDSQIDHLDVKGALARYQSTKKAALELWTRFPPKTHLFLGAGKSPTPIVGWMKAVGGEDTARTIPLSNMGGFKPGGKDRRGRAQAYDENLVQRLREHFDAFLPSPGELAGRDLVVIDFVERGDSLENTVREIRDYLAKRYAGSPWPTPGLKVVGIPQDDEAAVRIINLGFEVLRVELDLLIPIITSQFKQLHEYEDFKNDLSAPYKRPQRRTKAHLVTMKREGFDTLVEAYRSRAQSDRALRALLSKIFPEPQILKLPTPPPTFLESCSDWLWKVWPF